MAAFKQNTVASLRASGTEEEYDESDQLLQRQLHNLVSLKAKVILACPVWLNLEVETRARDVNRFGGVGRVDPKQRCKHEQRCCLVHSVSKRIMTRNYCLQNTSYMKFHTLVKVEFSQENSRLQNFSNISIEQRMLRLSTKSHRSCIS